MHVLFNGYWKINLIQEIYIQMWFSLMNKNFSIKTTAISNRKFFKIVELVVLGLELLTQGLGFLIW